LFFGAKEGSAVYEGADFGRAPTRCSLCERLKVEASRWSLRQPGLEDPSPLLLVRQIEPNV
jgi:hypothetical protein